MNSEKSISRVTVHSPGTHSRTESEQKISNGSSREQDASLDFGRIPTSTLPPTASPANSSSHDVGSNENHPVTADLVSQSAPAFVSHSDTPCEVKAAEDSVSPPKPRWRRVQEDGQCFYVNETTDEKWIPATDSGGQTYYYEARSRISVWTLDDFIGSADGEDSEVGVTGVDPHNIDGTRDDVSISAGISTSTHVGGSDDAVGLTDSHKEKRISGNKFQTAALRLSSLRPLTRLFSDGQPLEPLSPSPDDLVQKPSAVARRFSRNQITAEHISGPLENKLSHFERRGIVNRTKYIENNIRVNKRWSECVLTLSGPWLFFRKRAALQQGKLEFKLHVQKIDFSEATEVVTSRKHALMLQEKDEQGNTNAYLIQTSDAKLMNCWKAAIDYAKQLLDNEDRLTYSLAKGTLKNLPETPSKLDSRLTSRLRDFFRSRPSAESLRSRGILKNEPVFASTLVQICENENSEVPRFIVCVVRAIEARGLHHLGIYRVSANAADVQKLRCCVNQYNYSLNSEKWTLEVLTGSLKLFFRELREPLFTFDVFPKIQQLFASNMSDSEMVPRLQEVLRSMPTPHIVTARVLFHHLYRVTQHCSSNQMHPHKLALIFGPGLLRPEDDSARMDTVTTLQAPFINFSLQHVTELFGPVVPPPVVV
ncbi:unnamed protein product [Dicrocoelium dendriticum]|nr:unnamed protein product [Dicrocoelium dendriticum]